MAPVTQNSSSIAMALAGMTASVNIPKPHDGGFWTGRDSFAAVAARSLPTKKQSGMLPTPPNSISPSLPPHAFHDKGRTSTVPPTPPAGPTHVDSDIDLQDAVDHAKAQDQPQRGLSLSHHPGNLAGLDAAGAITPGLLAKHHLPSILLSHGPLAIRHIMGHLTTSVPGFSGIPPAKARRLVVGALEGRGSGGEAGGLHGDVDFEKVGWGRWDAKQRGHPRRSRSRPGLSTSQPTPPHHPSPPPSTPPSLASCSPDSERDSSGLSRSSEAENEADKMSLDGADESCSSSDAPGGDEDVAPEDEVGDVTDEEDWASIGAAALRLGSLSRMETADEVEFAGQGVAGGVAEPEPLPLQQGQGMGMEWSGFGGGGGEQEQEREAIEALVRLSEV
ncbi:MAG: Sin3 binding [Lasallia pustulata]|uniref:Sin3 binding n=1 Tax=Lasallia pustulata TaxID=136370 RepID=A0A5M8PCT1_9LECA|nr:MAG: Sin3 binding [Lasallia pustulata]